MIQELESWGVRFKKTSSGDYDVKKVHHRGSYVLPMPEAYALAPASQFPMSRGAIRLIDGTLTFGVGQGAVTALESLSLTVRPGDFLSLLGPSGCGKSSLISAIAGFQPLQAGTLKIDGEDVSGPGPDRGVVFQQPTLFRGKRSVRMWSSG